MRSRDDDDQDVLRQWLENGLKKKGKTQRGLALALGFDSHASVSKLLPHSKNKQNIKIWQIKIIEKYIGEAAPVALPHVLTNDKIKVFFAGFVAHDIWVGGSMKIAENTTEIAPYESERYLGIRQEAYKIIDDHAMPFAPAGAYVVTVDYADADLAPQAGDFVVLRRVLGDLVEKTIRKVVRINGGLALASASEGNVVMLPVPISAEISLCYIVGIQTYIGR